MTKKFTFEVDGQKVSVIAPDLDRAIEALLRWMDRDIKERKGSGLTESWDNFGYIDVRKRVLSGEWSHIEVEWKSPITVGQEVLINGKITEIDDYGLMTFSCRSAYDEEAFLSHGLNLEQVIVLQPMAGKETSLEILTDDCQVTQIGPGQRPNVWIPKKGEVFPFSFIVSRNDSYTLVQSGLCNYMFESKKITVGSEVKVDVVQQKIDDLYRSGASLQDSFTSLAISIAASNKA